MFTGLLRQQDLVARPERLIDMNAGGIRMGIL
jgi:hypothetical protein